MRILSRFVLIVVLLGSGLACNLAQSLPDFATPTEALVEAPVENIKPTQVPETAVLEVTPGPTTGPVVLDICSLLTQDEAAQALGEPVKNVATDTSCIYSDAATGKYEIGAYAFQGAESFNFWDSRVYLLSIFGLQIDQSSVDEIKAWDAVGNHKAVIEKLTLLSSGQSDPQFVARGLSGDWGDVAFWFWKDPGNGMRQGFVVAVKGDVLAGVDLVHGEKSDEAAAFEVAHQTLLRLFERLPARFTVPLATPTIPPAPASGAGQVELDPCMLLTPEEASQSLGEPVKEAVINGGACTYSDAATGVHVISAYAFPASTSNFWSGRVFLLSAFGLPIDQPSLDEIKAWDAAGNHKAVIEKLILLSANNPPFVARGLSGDWGDVGYSAWKDLGNGVRQGFVISVKGDVIAGMDMVHGEALDEPAFLDIVHRGMLRLFERLPAQFIVVTPAAKP